MVDTPQEKPKIRWHKGRDLNDPRYFAVAGPLPSLNEDPELPVEAKEVVEVQVADNVVTRLGADPNDVRLVAGSN